MNKRLGVVLVLAGVVALVLAACGGGEATATPQPTRPAQPTATSAPAATPTAPTRATATSAPAASATPAPTATQAPRPTATPAPTAPVATPTASGPQPKTGGTLQVRWYNDFRQWDTWHASGGFTYPFTKAILSNLVQYKQGTFDIVGDLAQSWDVSGDGKVFTFRLQKDAQWHDGKPVTSKDILYTFQRGSDPRFVFNKARVGPIQSMDTPDGSTIKVTLKNVSNAFLPQVATPFVLMYPGHIDPTTWQKTAIGSGPFKFGADKPSTAYEFTRNPNYYGKDAQGRRLPYLDGITFNVIVDVQLALSAFITGRLHCGCGHAETWVIRNADKIKADVPGAKLQPHLGTLLYLQFNLKKPPFDNAAFRQGLAIGLDKEKMGAVFASGQNYRPAPRLIPPAYGGRFGLPKEEVEKLQGYNPDHAVDMRIANQKIQQSGIDPKRTRVEILGPTAWNDMADLIGSVLTSDFGIQATVTISQSTAEQTDRRIRGDYTTYLDSTGGVIDDPADWFRDALSTGGAQNYMGYSNARYDELLLAQDKELDAAKRKQMAWEMQRIDMTDFPEVPLLWVLSMRVTRPDVQNFRVGPLNLQNYDWSDIWLDKVG